MAYSMDLRRRVVEAVEAGEKIATVARRFSVAWPTVKDWRDRARRDELEPAKPGPKGPIKLTEADDQLMRQEVEKDRGVTANALLPKLSVTVVESTVCRRLNKLGLVVKKIADRRRAAAAGRGRAA